MIELMSWNLLPPTTARPSLQAIVLGHTFAFMQMHTSNFGLTGIVSDRESVIGIIGNRHVQQNGTSIAFLSVDTFFFFSGFLAFYSMLTTIQSLEMNSPECTHHGWHAAAAGARHGDRRPLLGPAADRRAQRRTA